MANYIYNSNATKSDESSLLLLKAQKAKGYCELLIGQCDIWLPPKNYGDTSDDMFENFKRTLFNIKNNLNAIMKKGFSI